ncbi:hypothetical protein G9C85_03395 [Halorubellus sp. JP-L1]|uniref:hypothetical protein n=1 Tax=Halorubellus sp. JP-L1 TaxID=2715753 RepID=UPI001408E051|nr:hypothetical protein [Halorubellus sp. JP-L1]NHN40681.1 hypothetical protein [Halorubellus sp. JP-L1]
MRRSSSRRWFVLATTACVGSFAGCVDADGDDPGGSGADADSTTGTDGTATVTSEGGAAGATTTTEGEGTDGDSTTSDGGSTANDDDSTGSDADSTTDDESAATSETDEEASTTTDEGAETADGGGTRTKADLDLQEANVTGVEIEEQGGGEILFSVTLYHDDDGEDGYANWWTVETLDGEELGRRELLHEHGTGEFTREQTISVPDDVDCVVVRGHDQMHDYGGQAAIVSVPSGETRFVDQGQKRKSFADTYCP